MITIATITDQNKQPEPPKRKPNEDCCASSIYSNETRATTIVMDGIPVLRDLKGNYPPINESGFAAASLAARTIKEMLYDCNLFGKSRMAEAFAQANRNIAANNKYYNLYAKSPARWSATVGCALLLDTLERRATFGYIGDPVTFFIPEIGKPRLLARDQLGPSIVHWEKTGHPQINADGNQEALREWQDKYVRNSSHARCWCGTKVRGWGALTGEPAAMKFFEIQTIRLPSSGRFILASDAICVFGGKEKRRRLIAHYEAVLADTRRLSAKTAAREFLRLTREKERTEKVRSDDATFCVVDFEC